MSGAKGNLHIDERFDKAKRSVMWFCAFAILLWLVHVPVDGTIEPTMLGSAKVDFNWLRAVAWAACFYSMVAFYREAQNVYRLNSEALYVPELTSIRDRLAQLAENFETIAGDTQKLIAMSETVKFLGDDALDEASLQLRDQITGAMALIDGEISRGSKPEVIAVFVDQALTKLVAIAEAGFNAVKAKEQHNDILMNRTEQIISGQSVVKNAVINIQHQFDRFGHQIRGEHRWLFTWYDNYLTYGMFALATVLSGWSIIKPAREWSITEVSAIDWAETGKMTALILLGLAIAFYILITVMSLQERRLARRRPNQHQ